jgi:MFS family permease
MHWDALRHEQNRLVGVLSAFLVVTLAVILAPAIVGIIHVEWLKTWPWTPTLLYIASALLAIGPVSLVIYEAWKAIRRSRALLSLALLLLASPALAGPVGRCLTYEEKTLQRWETTITESARKACTGHLNPRSHQVEVKCR